MFEISELVLKFCSTLVLFRANGIFERANQSGAFVLTGSVARALAGLPASMFRGAMLCALDHRVGQLVKHLVALIASKQPGLSNLR